MNAHWKTLRFGSVGWSADHLRDFAEALPLFTNLKDVGFAEQPLRRRGGSGVGWSAQGAFDIAPTANYKRLSVDGFVNLSVTGKMCTSILSSSLEDSEGPSDFV